MFIAGDLLVLDKEYAVSKITKTFNSKMTIAHASNFFYLFSQNA